MDFNSLGSGNPFYILKRGDMLEGTPTLETGSVKSKSQPHVKFPTQTPNLMAGLQTQQVIDIIASVNGKDVTFTDIPLGVEIASRGDMVFSGSREAMLQAIDGMMQESRKALAQTAYHNRALPELEKMVETLNPQYAESKQNARVIQTLQEKQDAQDKQLSELKAQNTEMLQMLRQLTKKKES